MTKRNDIHTPTNAQYADYDFELAFYEGSNADARMAYGEQRKYKALVKAAREAGELFEAGHGGCDHCGALYMHGVLIRHTPTGQYLRIGHQCAERFFGGFKDARDAKRNIERRMRNIRKDREYQARTKLDRDAVLAVNPGLKACLALDHHIIADIAGRFERYGKISDKQIELVYKIARDVWTPERPPIPTAPVVEGKGVEVEGEVLSAKVRENDWGVEYKMLVRDDRGFKVWGTVPTSIIEAMDATAKIGSLKGSRVYFVANVKASDDDPTFGFAKRPRKAALLQAA